MTTGIPFLTYWIVSYSMLYVLKNYSKGTIRGYRESFNFLLGFSGLSSIKEVNREIMEDFSIMVGLIEIGDLPRFIAISNALMSFTNGV